MCDVHQALYEMVREAQGMTYPKLGMMVGEDPKKLQALFDPDREDRPFQLKHFIPAMTACNDLRPLMLINAHFELSTYKLKPGDLKKLDIKAAIDLMSEATGATNEILTAMDPNSPAGSNYTRDETNKCIEKVLLLMEAGMRILNFLQKKASEF